eukprot:5341098-Pleurochrysis_carterae.AAC.10
MPTVSGQGSTAGARAGRRLRGGFDAGARAGGVGHVFAVTRRPGERSASAQQARTRCECNLGKSACEP